VSTVSAIIVTWNGRDLLSACLDSLHAQTCHADEILVVDNGSHDGSQAMIWERYPDVTLIELHQNKGFSIANNVGIQRATGDYIALLNNDLVLDPSWTARMVAALNAYPALGSCACKMLSYDHRDTVDAAGVSVLTNGVGANRGMFEHDSAFYHQPTLVFGPCAGAAMYRASLFRDIGVFDEDLYIYYEDVDLAFRAQLAGYDCLYVPEAVAYHHHGASSGRFGKRDYFLARNSLPVLVKNMPAPLLRRYLLRIVVGQLPYAFYAGARGQTGLYALACLDSLRMLPRLLRKRGAIQRAARRSPEEIAARLT
jgi:GT2 family glycosyltransferase